jgi:hypothetical protein
MQPFVLRLEPEQQGLIDHPMSKVEAECTIVALQRQHGFYERSGPSRRIEEDGADSGGDGLFRGEWQEEQEHREPDGAGGE